MSGKIRGAVLALLRYFVMCLLLFAACILLTAAAGFFAGDRPVSAPIVEKSRPVIVIDAGHGGMDSGAVGVDGTFEKDINLSVAKKLAALFAAADCDVVMTRTEDVMLVEDSVTSHRKMHDLKNRLAVVESLAAEGESPILVSIHMNKFTESKYSGLQVWYAPADDASRQLAESVQSYARTFLDPANTREIKRAASSIYILDHVKSPAILVECGFLSNADECARLGTAEYQNAVAVTIFAGIMAQLEC
ncbi:MAG: hypothetical protein E7632_07960 [Ruminococcaceae bacterium]|nr:hypothetical protein [Oscillospiraceae bacterium]